MSRPFGRLQNVLVVVACVLSAPGGLLLFMAGAPSDPCRQREACGPDPSSYAVLGLVLLVPAVLVGLAAAAVRRARSALHFQAPPGWPPPPPGWDPPPGWRPDPGWPPAPEDWSFWRP